jgi:hypothetical protein
MTFRPARSKYGNKKCVMNGVTFDSIGERDRYFYLTDAQRRGEITHLVTQQKFPLWVGDMHVCDYIADFVYTKNTASGPVPIVEDFKGMQTDVFRLKKKLMLAVLGIEIKIIKKPTEAI